MQHATWQLNATPSVISQFQELLTSLSFHWPARSISTELEHYAVGASPINRSDYADTRKYLYAQAETGVSAGI